MYKEDLINNLHKIYRNDPWLNELLKSAGIQLQDIETAMNDMEEQFWFDTMTWGIPFMETMLNFKTNPLLPIEDRRSQLEAKWKVSGKCDLELIQQVAKSWRNGQCEVAFVNGAIQLSFNGDFGVPNDLQGLLDLIEDIKPSHLGVICVIQYLLIKNIHNVVTLNTMQGMTLNKFAGGI